MSNGPYAAVCGKCNVPLELHPVESCPHDYQPIRINGRVYGYKMLDKKNGETKKQENRKSAEKA